MSESWRVMEQFSQIARSRLVYSEDLISKRFTRLLMDRGLVKWSIRHEGFILSWRGWLLWILWRDSDL